MSGSHEIADEVTQDAFLLLLRKPEMYASESCKRLESREENSGWRSRSRRQHWFVWWWDWR
jgi:hypothetical protein